ncbi:uncharacterized protein [Cicer arietinum]|uniref:uncharacterized protein n=1 Tax=Cicer arietinum TaxID=3827 RepID=UPI003CC59A86
MCIVMKCIMDSKRCSLIFLLLCVLLSFSAKIMARNIAGASEHCAASNEMDTTKRLLAQENQRSPCKRGRVTFDVTGSDRKNEPKDDPRCHNFL